MNFKIGKKEFLDALSLSIRAVSSTTPLPSLSGIKISATDNSLILISSDSNISIKTTIEIGDNSSLSIFEAGEALIDSRYLLEIVRKIDSEFINVEIIDGTLIQIYGGNSQFKINGMQVEEYPEINFDINDNKKIILNTNLFNQIIDETAFACSDKETRPVLTGVNFKAENGKLYVNATDSYRLASKTLNIESNFQFNITIPSKYLNDISYAISSTKQTDICIDNYKVAFVFVNTIITTRLLDDSFPDTTRLIPSEFSQILKVNSREILNAIDRSSFIKSEGKNIIKMNINSDKIEMTSSNQIGSSYETISLLSYEGQPLEISCSGKYLQDAIKAIGGDEITIKFSGELKPMVVQNDKDDNLIQLISPVRTYH